MIKLTRHFKLLSLGDAFSDVIQTALFTGHIASARACLDPVPHRWNDFPGRPLRRGGKDAPSSRPRNGTRTVRIDHADGDVRLVGATDRSDPSGQERSIPRRPGRTQPGAGPVRRFDGGNPLARSPGNGRPRQPLPHPSERPRPDRRGARQRARRSRDERERTVDRGDGRFFGGGRKGSGTNLLFPRR